MGKVYTINGKIVKTWFRRGKARIPVFEDGTIGHSRKAYSNEDYKKQEEIVHQAKEERDRLQNYVNNLADDYGEDSVDFDGSKYELQDAEDRYREEKRKYDEMVNYDKRPTSDVDKENTKNNKAVERIEKGKNTFDPVAFEKWRQEEDPNYTWSDDTARNIYELRKQVDTSKEVDIPGFKGYKYNTETDTVRAMTPKEKAREIDKINSKSIKNDNEDVISNKQFEQASKIDDKLERAVQMQVADDVGKTLNDDDIRFRAENYIRHNYNGDASTDEIYKKLKSAYKNNGIYESTPSSTEDYNKINEKTTFNFGKVDAYGTGRKSNEITVEAQIKDGVFTASGNVWNSKHTDIISGGQNLDELKGYLKGNKEFENVYNMWKKYHLNDMHAGTVKQEEALNKKFGGVNANKYKEQVDYLKSVGLYEDEGYKYGTGWLKRDIPEEDMKNIVDTIRRNNSGTNSTSNYKLQYDNKNQRQQMTYKSNAYDDTEYAWARTEDYDVNGEWTIKNPLTKKEEYVKGKEDTEKRLNEINNAIQKSKRTTNNEGVSKFSLGKMSTAELRNLANEYGLKSNELSRKQLLAELIAVFNK